MADFDPFDFPGDDGDEKGENEAQERQERGDDDEEAEREEEQRRLQRKRLAATGNSSASAEVSKYALSPWQARNLKQSSCSSSPSRGVAYFVSDELIRSADKLPKNRGRSSHVHSLVRALPGLLLEEKTRPPGGDWDGDGGSGAQAAVESLKLAASGVTKEAERKVLPFAVAVAPAKATREELEEFHTTDYVRSLLDESRSGRDDDDCDADDGLDDAEPNPKKRRRREFAGPLAADRADRAQIAEEEETGLEFDCARFPGLRDYSLRVAGATLHAASVLSERQAQVAIHWDGGRHHAQAHMASGFCFVNDVVLGTLHLLGNGFERVLYLDIDCHAGDGVASAFYFSPRVLTVSVHCQEAGFFPGEAGASSLRGEGAGKGSCVNVGLRAGLRDSGLDRIVREVVGRAFALFQPDAIVCVAGCDGLARDPLGRWNLTPHAFAGTMRFLREFNVPLLVLGGGGYDSVSASLCWAACTAALVGRDDLDTAPVPSHDLFDKYGSVGYSMGGFEHVRTMEDENTETVLSDAIKEALEHLENTFGVDEAGEASSSDHSEGEGV